MFAAGTDGQLYRHSEAQMQWALVNGAPLNVIRVGTGPWWEASPPGSLHTRGWTIFG